VSVSSWLRLTVCLWLLRKAVKGAGWLLVFAVVIAAWPLTLVTATGYVLAWRRGWPGAWLGRTAAWSLALPLAWLTTAAIHAGQLRASALAAVRAWEHGWPYPATWLAATREVALFVPATVPAGLALAAGLWAWRNYAITTGLGGITASAPITFDNRQWKHQVRTAKGLTEAPGAVPLLAKGGKIPVGGTIRTIGHHWDPVFTLPHTACARHMVIVGATGSGKTNLMIRLWAGWFTATSDAAWAGKGAPPQLIVLDCKGGPDARRKAGRARRLLYGADARRVALARQRPVPHRRTALRPWPARRSTRRPARTPRRRVRHASRLPARHRQATIVLTITDTTPGVIAAILTGPRIDHGTAATQPSQAEPASPATSETRP
jgi:hypothetical protein